MHYNRMASFKGNTACGELVVRSSSVRRMTTPSITCREGEL